MKKLILALAFLVMLSMTGYSAAYVLTGVTISGVANTYRGDYDTVTCTGLISGSGVGASGSIALQYNDSGNWINVTVSNANNVSQLSTNPQTYSGKKANVVDTFVVLAMRTGAALSNKFRCWGTDGTNTYNSTNNSMAILTPNLQANVTNTSTATIYTDDTNDFNITCNVSTQFGNASIVHMTVYYNTSTSNTWNTLGTSKNVAIYSNLNPLYQFQNVDNADVPRSLNYSVYANATFVAATYWFNCSVNSSLYDGNFRNTTDGKASFFTTYTVVASYAFTITVPGGNYSNSSTTMPGGGNPIMNFTYNGTWGGSQSYVNCSFNYSGQTYWQNSATPALQFKNLGTTALTWSIKMNNSLPSWAILFANVSNTIPLTGGSAFVFTTTSDLALPVGSGATVNLWVYANFTNVAQLGGTTNQTQLNHSSA